MTVMTNPLQYYLAGREGHSEYESLLDEEHMSQELKGNTYFVYSN